MILQKQILHKSNYYFTRRKTAGEKSAYEQNRFKHWKIECAKRNVKLKRMQNLPPPPPMFCTANRNELLEVWNGFRKTRTVPHIYYKPAIDPAEEQRGFEEFNQSWREQFVSACRAARSGRRPVAVRFKMIPAFEGKVTLRSEPTALIGYEIHRSNSIRVVRGFGCPQLS